MNGVPKELVMARNQPSLKLLCRVDQPDQRAFRSRKIARKDSLAWWLSFGEVFSEVAGVDGKQPGSALGQVNPVGHVPGRVARSAERPHASSHFGVAVDLAPFDVAHG